MTQWTSAVGAAQLARLLSTQQARPAGPGTRKPPAYRALADGIRVLVLEGRVPVAARLPAERELAVALAVSRTTVAAAYEALRAEGFLESRRGAGSWTAVPAGNPLPARGLEPLPPETLGSMIDLGTAALPAPEPWLTRSVQGALGELGPYAHTHGDYPAGLPALRQKLADRYTAQGIPTMPEQIMVTTGAMGAMDAICHLFAGRGERIAVESPSYANILQLMREAGARLVPVAMAEGLRGWDLPRWRQVLRDAAPRIAYVVADFHNPTGALADEEQRRGLVDAARSAGTVLVVDETMTELILDEDTEMPRPVCAFDPAGSTVLTVGSASKAFWAGMRIGWVRAAPDVIRSLVSARAYADLGTPVLEQLAINWLMSTGGWDEAVAIRRAQARENRDALVTAVRRELPGWEFDVPHGGLTLWVRTGGLSGSRLAEVGERVGVRVPSGPRFGVDGAFEGYVRLPFTVGGRLADEAAQRLAAAARLVETGASTGTDAPRTFVA
ncbi:PLP-dependent aminotransferase family protein [Streptomyces sp. NBC_00859]|uniref:SCO1417 family MocR-like transcription factor n=1 Tax=Streptomyces sp. NBC_00859 TaxID=2903682 RepID=UPI003869FBA0|nr:PLP-dependent aminotransferase family protein [Streptomyces sp. NBC_00859]